MLRLSLPGMVGAGRLELDKKLLRATLRSAGGEVVSVARSLIRASGEGKDQAHRTSLPGEAPSSHTGALAAGIKVNVFKSGEGVSIVDTARSRSGSGAPYPLFLEMGARGGGGKKGSRNAYKRVNRKYVLVSVTGTRVVEPRPFLTAALTMREASILQRIKAAVESGMKFNRQKP